MGCNAAMNGLQTVSAFVDAFPNKIALLLCVEICSAAYVYNQKLSTVVVNSLFGDGAGAAILRCDDAHTWEAGPIIADFEPHIVTDALDAMKYELDGTKLSFYLDRDIPYVIGRNVEKPIQRLLGRHGLRVRDVDHWLIHSGGKKVIDAIEYNLGLTDYDVRHTLSVLKNHGNLSSGSVLFSFKELRREGLVAEKDIGVLIAMGPGTSIETALLTW
jgi:alkylresorcinol/alkylpyrone synthase/polyketide synthase Type III